VSVIPTLDHVVVNARDDLDAAAALWGRLGFTLTPRGRHTLGTINHLAMFGTDYLELIAAPSARDDLPPMRFPAGLNALVFGTEDAAATRAALLAAEVPAEPVLAFSRPVALPDGMRDAAFRTVGLPDGTLPGGRAYFCQHLTRDLVWRDEWRRHPNGVVGVAAVVISARDPAAVGARFERLFGAAAIAGIEGGIRLACGLTRIEVVAPSVAAERLGEAVAIADGQAAVMAGLLLRVVARARAGEALRLGGIPVREDAAGALVVPAASALGVVISFSA
jgi:hypothetical protein